MLNFLVSLVFGTVLTGLLAACIWIPWQGVSHLLLWAGWTEREIAHLMFVLCIPMGFLGVWLMNGLAAVVSWTLTRRLR
jgi:hypothetical protein